MTTRQDIQKLNNPKNVNTHQHRVNSFFAGIGGFDLGFERAGLKPVFHCEINKFCQSVLRRHWPDTLAVGDLNGVEPDDIPEAEVWCGGFPCQDVSVARGSMGREGLKGQNTGLFFPFAKLIARRLPTVVLMENVAGLLNSHGGKDFAVVLQTLNELGYGVAWRVFNTRYFGAPQSRPRVYICAWKESAEKAFGVLYENGRTFLPGSSREGLIMAAPTHRTNAVVPKVSFCLAATSGRHTGTDWSRSYVAYTDEVRRLTPTECERLQGFPANWTMPEKDFRPTTSDIDSLRYHAIGNAVSVPVVEWVAARIAQALDSAGKIQRPNHHRKFIGKLVSKVEDFNDVAVESAISLPALLDRDNAPSIKWKSGGVMLGGQCLITSVSPAPNKPKKSLFSRALDAQKPGKQYFLSPNAATGIIRRVKSQNRVLFEPLQNALERLAGKK